MVRVSDIEYVVYGHKNLDLAERFFTDFGLQTAQRTESELLMRGAGDRRYCYVARISRNPGLIAIGMRVPEAKDLVEAAAFPEATSVEPIDRDGGGSKVRLVSPDGIAFDIVHGIEPVEPIAIRDPLLFNHACTKIRTGRWQRAPLEPAAVLRLGHVALTTADYAANSAWLGSRLGMLPSDVLFDQRPDNALGGFFHCEGGSGWVDHHTIALFPGPAPKVHHCSFEVQDLDAQFLGNKYLLSRAWNPLWGVGRHVLGSQIFDYWFDPEGNVVEHFTDGDLVRAGHTPEFHQVSDESLAQWGPPMSVANFLDKVTE
jgi:catechol 2,3-dioxygenase-like lactoylglutathione lyase family enzyme